MNYTLTAFQEPRGVMRILQLIFAICAFATTAGFSVMMKTECNSSTYTKNTEIEYPFRFREEICNSTSGLHNVTADVSSDAQFFVATGVLSLMYCVFIIIVYALLDELYKSKTEIPLADFIMTLILAIFWLSGSAAWSNGTNGLKQSVNRDELDKLCIGCSFTEYANFSKLNISLILGFLNFFLWSSDLWFLYKETIWFQSRKATSTPTV